ncbi:MAG: glutaredoxin family protein [Proteobacteria bacterium]|nr:glutaredoxin family protein [Pseudomonadota bacterium]
MPTLVLYTTEDCHLCELAEELLEELQASRNFTLQSVDISADAALVDAYGMRIPVVKNPTTEQEIGWPFQVADLLSLF